MRFNLLTNELLAALVFTSDDLARYVLNGVLIELRHGKSPLLVSTDGRRLSVIKSQAIQFPNEPEFENTQFILSKHAIHSICEFDKTIEKSKGGIVIKYDSKIEVKFNDGTVISNWAEESVISGNFPDWRKVIPKTKSPTRFISLDAKYLSDYAKIAEHLEEPPGLHINLIGETECVEVLIASAPHFYSVLMPMKAHKEPNWQPEFLGMPEPTNKAA